MYRMRILAAPLHQPGDLARWRTLRYKLHKRAYHIQVVHKLEADNYPKREAECHDLLNAVENNLMQNVI